MCVLTNVSNDFKAYLTNFMLFYNPWLSLPFMELYLLLRLNRVVLGYLFVTVWHLVVFYSVVSVFNLYLDFI